MDPIAARTAKAIFAAVTEKHPTLELVMAWNQPMLRNEKGYVLGVMVSKNHILLLPLGPALETLKDRLAKYKTNKKTVKVPLDWKVDAALLRAMVKVRLDEVGRGG